MEKTEILILGARPKTLRDLRFWAKTEVAKRSRKVFGEAPKIYFSLFFNFGAPKTLDLVESFRMNPVSSGLDETAVQKCL